RSGGRCGLRGDALMSGRIIFGARLVLVAALTAAPIAWGQRFNELRWNGTLYPGQALVDPLHGDWQLALHGGCNPVLYRNGSARWATDTQNRGSNCRAVMQGDGNLVVYSGSTAVWASHTNGWWWAKLRLYADGGLYIAANGSDAVVWAATWWRGYTG